MAEVYTFDQRTAQRIIRAVQAIEAEQRSRSGGRAAGAPVVPLSACIVTPTAPAIGGGKYYGKLLSYPQADIAETGDVSAAELGTEPTDANCLILNTLELGQPTHDLLSDTPKVRHFLGIVRRINADGTIVVAIGGLDWATCAEAGA